jgi:uncharacterized protein YycO
VVLASNEQDAKTKAINWMKEHLGLPYPWPHKVLVRFAASDDIDLHGIINPT